MSLLLVQRGSDVMLDAQHQNSKITPEAFLLKGKFQVFLERHCVSALSAAVGCVVITQQILEIWQWFFSSWL